MRHDHGWWVTGVLVCASRAALALACAPVCNARVVTGFDSTEAIA